MIITDPSLIKKQRLKNKVLIFGAGVAGIILSLELKKSGIGSVLFEKGIYDDVLDKHYDDYKTTNHGSNLNYDGQNSRLPMFGGTSNHWGGQCKFLEPESYEFSNLGFLNNYYKRSFEYFELTNSNYKSENKNDDFSKITFFAKDSPKVFADYYNNIEKDNLIDVVLNASLTDLNISDSKVTKFFLNSKVSIDAENQIFVLTMGTIEILKLLLNIKQKKNDLFNTSIGRGFYDHLGVYNILKIYSDDYMYLNNFTWSKPDPNQMKYMKTIGFKDSILDKNINHSALAHIAISKNKDNFRGFKNMSLYGKPVFYISKLSDYSISLHKSLKDRFNNYLPNINFSLDERDLKIINKHVFKFINYFSHNKNIILQLSKNYLTQNYDIEDFQESAHHLGGLSFGSPTSIINESLFFNDIKNLAVSSGAIFKYTDISNPTLHIGTLSIYLSDVIKRNLKTF